MKLLHIWIEEFRNIQNQGIVLGVCLEVVHDTVGFQVIHLDNGSREFERVEFLADARVFFYQVLFDLASSGK